LLSATSGSCRTTTAASRCCYWRGELPYTAKVLGLTIPPSLLRLNVDLIVAGSTNAAAAAQTATKTIPIVMVGVRERRHGGPWRV
jgi:hypothetical protein